MTDCIALCFHNPNHAAALIGLALCGVRSSPRVGLAFAGLALSGCSSTVFDWPTLFDFAERGGLGMVNMEVNDSALHLHLKPPPSLSRRWEVEVEHGG